MGIHKLQTETTGLMPPPYRPFNESVKAGRRTGICMQKIEYFAACFSRSAIHLAASPSVFADNNTGTGSFRNPRGMIRTPSIGDNDFIRLSADMMMEKIDHFSDSLCFIKCRYDNTESRNRFFLGLGFGFIAGTQNFKPGPLTRIQSGQPLDNKSKRS